MKLTIFAVCLAVLVSCNSETKDANTNTADSSAATKSSDTRSSSDDAWVPVDSATAMKAMMEAGTPGKEQAMLAKTDGNWKAETTMWDRADAAPMKSYGDVKLKTIMDGRYQVMDFKGDMMGMKFEGTSTTGYDNARKLWVSTWVDNMSTGIMNLEGTWDEGTKTITYTGKMLCPANGKMCDIKQVSKWVDDKTQVMEMYGPDLKTGKSYKSMEIKLTKV
jgi:hypothetical protein